MGHQIVYSFVDIYNISELPNEGGQSIQSNFWYIINISMNMQWIYRHLICVPACCVLLSKMEISLSIPLTPCSHPRCEAILGVNISLPYPLTRAAYGKACGNILYSFLYIEFLNKYCTAKYLIVKILNLFVWHILLSYHSKTNGMSTYLEFYNKILCSSILLMKFWIWQRIWEFPTFFVIFSVC